MKGENKLFVFWIITTIILMFVYCTAWYVGFAYGALMRLFARKIYKWIIKEEK